MHGTIKTSVALGFGQVQMEDQVTHQEVEVWAREIVDAVLANQRIEDSKIELKSSWPEPGKAADRLAAHANAARGTAILWLIGVEEKNCKLTNVDPVELANWWKQVQAFFDGFAPRLLIDANVRIGSDTVVALYFETEQGAPFVVEYKRGGYPQFVVPWREGTALRAATRADLLRILVPIRRLSGLIDELEVNLAVAQGTPTIDSMGTLFREEEFHRAISDGALSALDVDERQLVIAAYSGMNRANQLVTVTLGVASQHRQPDQLNAAWNAVNDCRRLIENAREGLTRL
jgi:hypothetical protein